MKTKLFFNLILLVILSLPSHVAAQTNEFTYQGRLTDGSMLANATYDFLFTLYDAASGGTLLGTRARIGVLVSNGVFTVTLDFLATNFNGDARWLEIGVKPAGSGGGYQQLLPRQPITSSPYAIKSLNSEQLGGIVASGFVRNATAAQTASFNITGNGTIGGNLTVNGTLTANLPAGDSSYVQNRSTQQTATNFNISGNGTIGGTLSATTVNSNIFSGAIVNSTVYRIGDENVLKTFGTRNIFAGINAGGSGTDNSFFGYNAGNSNLANGVDNSFFGSDAGGANTSGMNNSFFGSDAGDTNTTGTNNTIVGSNADLASNNLQFATAIGAGVVVNKSNTIQIGRDNVNNTIDTVRIPVLAFKLKPLGTTDMCYGAADVDGYNLIGSCSSSIRFKSNVQTYTRGLEMVRHLRPVTFDWRDGGKSDVGFIAEEVEKVEPLLATYNDKDEIQGVKYKQISVLLVNAVNEQQSQIEMQQQQIELQLKINEQQKNRIEDMQTQFEVLKAAFCQTNPQITLCGKKNLRN